MECIRKIVVSGSPYERGRQQGEFLKPLIHENINSLQEQKDSKQADSPNNKLTKESNKNNNKIK